MLNILTFNSRGSITNILLCLRLVTSPLPPLGTPTPLPHFSLLPQSLTTCPPLSTSFFFLSKSLLMLFFSFFFLSFSLLSNLYRLVSHFPIFFLVFSLCVIFFFNSHYFRSFSFLYLFFSRLSLLSLLFQSTQTLSLSLLPVLPIVLFVFFFFSLIQSSFTVHLSRRFFFTSVVSRHCSFSYAWPLSLHSIVTHLFCCVYINFPPFFSLCINDKTKA